MPPRYHSDRFYDEGRIINPKSDTDGKEPVVDGKQDSVHDSPKCYNGSAQLFQLKYPPHHREKAGNQELFINTSPRFLPPHAILTLCDSIVERLSGENNARNPEGDT